ncbi:MAG: hypothetical protein EOR69_28515 [Mesorhizobium sp.]|nr:MAG: hypothetical protein EOR69_28515 [Mesorhizobium sp.]RWL95346.1 MAG: hypothetical protein EOR70_22515 [Mesorhizobium sp.]
MAVNKRDRVGASPPSEDGLNLWDFADPNEAANAALDVYGPDTITAAAHCALSAHFDGRERDYRFWFAVFSKLNGVRPQG